MESEHDSFREIKQTGVRADVYLIKIPDFRVD